MSSAADQLYCEADNIRVEASSFSVLVTCVFLLFLKHLATLTIQGQKGFDKRLQEDRNLVQNLISNQDDDSGERWNVSTVLNYF